MNAQFGSHPFSKFACVLSPKKFRKGLQGPYEMGLQGCYILAEKMIVGTGENAQTFPHRTRAFFGGSAEIAMKTTILTPTLNVALIHSTSLLVARIPGSFRNVVGKGVLSKDSDSRYF